jgi:hypothetical protein
MNNSTCLDSCLEKPISLFFPQRTPISSWIDLYPDCFVRADNPQTADFVIQFARFEEVLEMDKSLTWKTILFLRTGGAGRNRGHHNIREGRFVDEPLLSPAVRDILCQAALVFTYADLKCREYGFIGVPLSFNHYRNISQPEFYWKNPFDANGPRKPVVYWSGSQWTHSSRQIIGDLTSFSEIIYDLKDWKPKSVDGQNAQVYGKMKPHPDEYREFTSSLAHAQVALVIRGDLPWVFSFLDVIRFGAIPDFIDSGYPELGWKEIGFDPMNTFLAHDTRNNTINDINSDLHELLAADSRLMKVRNNITLFYKRFIQTDRFYLANQYHGIFTGWSDFYVAKIIQKFQGIHSLDFFSRQVLPLKGIEFAAM